MVLAVTLSPSRSRIVQRPSLRSRWVTSASSRSTAPAARAPLRKPPWIAATSMSSASSKIAPPAAASGFSNGWRRSASTGSSQRTLGTRRAYSAAAFCVAACCSARPAISAPRGVSRGWSVKPAGGFR